MPSSRIMASCVAPPFGRVSDKITHVNESLLSLTQSCTGKLSEWLYCWILSGWQNSRIPTLQQLTSSVPSCTCGWFTGWQMRGWSVWHTRRMQRKQCYAMVMRRHRIIECFQGGSISTKKAMRRKLKWIIHSLICKLTSLMGLIIWSDSNFLMYPVSLLKSFALPGWSWMQTASKQQGLWLPGRYSPSLSKLGFRLSFVFPEETERFKAGGVIWTQLPSTKMQRCTQGLLDSKW